MVTIIRNSTGMLYLLNFSMPLFTPPATIRQEMARKAVKQTTGFQDEPKKEANTPCRASGSDWRKPPVRDVPKYPRAQPPTTL